MPELILARFPSLSLGADSAPAEWLMFMPAGRHAISATQGGRTAEVDVTVDRSTAAALEQARRTHLAASPQRPFFDFDHRNEAAAAWPLEFTWKDQPAPGVYARVEWSAAGAQAVAGKAYRAFSPAFFLEEGRVSGAPLNMGGLVNNPAFKQISPLWAKDAGAISGDFNQGQQAQSAANTMTEQQIAELQAKLIQLEQDNAALKAKAASAETQEAIEAKTAEVAALQARLDSAEAALKAQRAEKAKAAVAAAVAAGRIPPKAAEVQAKWQALIEADPANEVLLASQPAAPAVQGRITSPTAQTPRADSALVVTDEDPRQIAKAYFEIAAKNAATRSIHGKIEAARDMGRIYARAIRDNKRFLDMPLAIEAAEGDDTLGTLSGTLVTQRVLDLVKLQLPLLRLVATDFSDENAAFAQTITTRYITVPGVESYTATLGTDNRPAGWAVTTPPTATDVSITINAHKGVVLNFDSNALAETARRLFDEFTPGAAYALAKNMHDALLAVITKSNFASPAYLAAPVGDFGRPTFGVVSSGFNAAGVPMSNRFALLNSTYWAKLTQDPTIVSLAVYQKPTVITDEELPAISKFTPYECPNLPSTGDMAAFFGHKSALMIATRVPNDYTAALPGAGNGRVQVITNPEDGLSVLLTEYVNHTGGYAERRISLMYGVAKGQTTCGRIITTK